MKKIKYSKKHIIKIVLLLNIFGVSYKSARILFILHIQLTIQEKYPSIYLRIGGFVLVFR